MTDAFVAREKRRGGKPIGTPCPGCGKRVPDIDEVPPDFCPFCGMTLSGALPEDDDDYSDPDDPSPLNFDQPDYTAMFRDF